MNKNKKILVIVISTIIIVTSCGLLLDILYHDSIDNNEHEFLKAFASHHIDESDPNWECKKVLGLYELAKQNYPHFEENTKWLADKKCGFDVSNIIP